MKALVVQASAPTAVAPFHKRVVAVSSSAVRSIAPGVVSMK